MFQVAKESHGEKGAFVKLVELDSDDFVVIVRYPSDARLQHRYVGPDFMKAEEVFDFETEKVGARKENP